MGFLFSFGATFLFSLSLKNLSKIFFLTRVVEEDVDIYIILLLNIYVSIYERKEKEIRSYCQKCTVMTYFFG